MVAAKRPAGGTPPPPRPGFPFLGDDAWDTCLTIMLFRSRAQPASPPPQNAACVAAAQIPDAASPDAASPDAAPPDAAPPDAALDLVRRWCELSQLERRAFMALGRELRVSSDLVEQSTLDLSERFQVLAEIARAQVGRMARIVEVASTLTVSGESVPLDAALQSVDGTLVRAIETVLFVSKHAMRMVYTLEDMEREVSQAEQCSGQIEIINRQARYLALNATIEAARSGAAGAAFAVIADEMKQLSQATAQTALQVRDRIGAVRRGVGRGREVLQEIATLDLSQNILAKERIDGLLAGIAAQHAAFGTVLAETASASTDMAATVDRMITGMQFQDRTKQHLAQVIDTLGVLQDGAEALQKLTAEHLPGQIPPGGVDETALGRIIEKQTLGAMKARILMRLLTDDAALDEAAHPANDEGGEVELF
jgi:methyl-accepting chemotaxis protein